MYNINGADNAWDQASKHSNNRLRLTSLGKPCAQFAHQPLTLLETLNGEHDDFDYQNDMVLYWD